jgi:hypothetical protein
MSRRYFQGLFVNLRLQRWQCLYSELANWLSQVENARRIVQRDCGSSGHSWTTWDFFIKFPTTWLLSIILWNLYGIKNEYS